MILQEEIRKEENSELRQNAAELLSKEERLSSFTDRRNKASHECEYCHTTLEIMKVL